MIRIDVAGGVLVIDPSGASVMETGRSIVVNVPVQLRRDDGVVEVGSVYVGTEPVEVVVREARRWAAGCAQSARSEGNVPENGDGYLTSIP